MSTAIELPPASWWEDATRADIILLAKALRAGSVPPAKRDEIFTALERQAAAKGGRFARSFERLKAEFGCEGL